jgi:hypothetical protein
MFTHAGVHVRALDGADIQSSGHVRLGPNLCASLKSDGSQLPPAGIVVLPEQCVYCSEGKSEAGLRGGILNSFAGQQKAAGFHLQKCLCNAGLRLKESSATRGQREGNRGTAELPLLLPFPAACAMTATSAALESERRLSDH